MKKILIAAIACLSLGSAACYAGETAAATTVATTTSAWYNGTYKNGTNWIYIYNDNRGNLMVAVTLNGTRRDYSAWTENSFSGSIVVHFNDEIMSVFDNGKVYYNNTWFEK